MNAMQDLLVSVWRKKLESHSQVVKEPLTQHVGIFDDMGMRLNNQLSFSRITEAQKRSEHSKILRK